MLTANELIIDIKPGQIILIQHGRNDALVSYTEFGKVIIVTNESAKVGYARVTKVVKDAERFILVEAENVIHDYYDGIDYEDFTKVLQLHNYKIGFDRPFDSEYGVERQLLVYNIEKGVVIVAETYYGTKGFNSIKVYCPNVPASRKFPCFRMGGVNMSVLDLCSGKGMKNMLSRINNLIENPVWPTDEDIFLWTYMDSRHSIPESDTRWGFASSKLWADTIDRLLLADIELEKILGNCKCLKPVFASRNK